MAFKFCPECGFKLDKEYKFCPECGFKLQSESKSNAPQVKDEFQDLSDSFDSLIKKSNSNVDKIEEDLKKANLFCIRNKFKEAKELYQKVYEADSANINAYIGFLRVESQNFEVLTEESEKEYTVLSQLFAETEILSVCKEYKNYLNIKKEKEEKEKADALKKYLEEKERKARLSLPTNASVYNNDPKFIQIGFYPQTLKAKNVKILGTTNVYGLKYFGDDECLYELFEGNYYKYESIRWDKSHSFQDYFSTKILDYTRYRDSATLPKDPWVYGDSALRSFLLSFKRTAFSPATDFKKPNTLFSQKASRTLYVSPGVKSKFEGKEYEDCIYPLNIGELYMLDRNKFIYSHLRVKKTPTDYAKARYKALYKKVYNKEAKTVPCVYWTSSQHPTDPTRMLVIDAGKNFDLYQCESYTTDQIAGVAPVLNIDRRH